MTNTRHTNARIINITRHVAALSLMVALLGVVGFGVRANAQTTGTTSSTGDTSTNNSNTSTGTMSITGTANSTTSTTSTSTASTTAPIFSNIVATPTDTGATITWMTDQNSDAQVWYGLTTAYGASTTLDRTLGMNHSQALTGLMPNTMYHYRVTSSNGGGMMGSSLDGTFMTTMTASTSDQTLQQQIDSLRAEVRQLEHIIAMLLASLNSTGTGMGTGTGSMTHTGASVDQNGKSFSAGGAIDFSGRNFTPEQPVTVTLNGKTVATAHADGGGNFSTGSIALPSTAGTYTYGFAGQSGAPVNASITVR